MLTCMGPRLNGPKLHKVFWVQLQCHPILEDGQLHLSEEENVEQLTCKVIWMFLFIVFILLSLLELKPLQLKRKSWKKSTEKRENCWKGAKKCEKCEMIFALYLLPFKVALNLAGRAKHDF